MSDRTPSERRPGSPSRRSTATPDAVGVQGRHAGTGPGGVDLERPGRPVRGRGHAGRRRPAGTDPCRVQSGRAQRVVVVLEPWDDHGRRRPAGKHSLAPGRGRERRPGRPVLVEVSWPGRTSPVPGAADASRGWGNPDQVVLRATATPGPAAVVEALHAVRRGQAPRLRGGPPGSPGVTSVGRGVRRRGDAAARHDLPARLSAGPVDQRHRLVVRRAGHARGLAATEATETTWTPSGADTRLSSTSTGWHASDSGRAAVSW